LHFGQGCFRFVVHLQQEMKELDHIRFRQALDRFQRRRRRRGSCRANGWRYGRGRRAGLQPAYTAGGSKETADRQKKKDYVAFPAHNEVPLPSMFNPKQTPPNEKYAEQRFFTKKILTIPSG
jgi:hypothetical protein